MAVADGFLYEMAGRSMKKVIFLGDQHLLDSVYSYWQNLLMLI